jgi:hypothetical protein
MRNNVKDLMRLFGEVPVIVTDLDPSIPMCKICGVAESEVTVVRWHNNFRTESDECAECAMQPLTFTKENSCGRVTNVLLLTKGIKTK